MTVFAIYNQKGGVGKTATTVNLAYRAAVEGKKTLLWDLDPQGAAGYYFQAEPTVQNEAKKLLSNELDISDSIQESGYDNLDLITSDLSARNADIIINELKGGKRRLKSALAPLKKEYDLVFLDCPPGLSLLHDHIFAAADWVLIPNIPTPLSLRSFEIVQQYFAANKLDSGKLKGFFSMVDNRKNLHAEIVSSYYRDKMFLRKTIPYLSDIEKMGIELAPLDAYAVGSIASQAYRDLWKEIKKLSQV